MSFCHGRDSRMAIGPRWISFYVHRTLVVCDFFCSECFGDRITGRGRRKKKSNFCHRLRMWSKSASFFSLLSHSSSSTTCATDNKTFAKAHNDPRRYLLCFFSSPSRRTIHFCYQAEVVNKKKKTVCFTIRKDIHLCDGLWGESVIRKSTRK